MWNRRRDFFEVYPVSKRDKAVLYSLIGLFYFLLIGGVALIANLDRPCSIDDNYIMDIRGRVTEKIKRKANALILFQGGNHIQRSPVNTDLWNFSQVGDSIAKPRNSFNCTLYRNDSVYYFALYDSTLIKAIQRCIDERAQEQE